jgi:predicted nucleic acid-binding protein
LSRRHKIAAADIEELTALLRERAEIAAVAGTLRVCRDPDDDMVIEAARVGRADVLVTRDDDLKRDWDLVELLQVQGVRVLSVARFLEEIEG